MVDVNSFVRKASNHYREPFLGFLSSYSYSPFFPFLDLTGTGTWPGACQYAWTGGLNWFSKKIWPWPENLNSWLTLMVIWFSSSYLDVMLCFTNTDLSHQILKKKNYLRRKVKDCRSTSYKTWGPWKEENRKYVGKAAIIFCPVRNLLVKTVCFLELQHISLRSPDDRVEVCSFSD